jgi:hypothetical protein
MRTGQKVCFGVLTFFILATFVYGFVGLIALPNIVRSQINDALHLSSPRSALYKLWQKPASNGVKIYQAFFINNLTNLEGVRDRGEAPQLEEIGPYTYWEKKEMLEDTINWRPNGTVQYTYRETYEFQPSMSTYKGRALSESDMFLNVNMALQGVITIAQGQGALLEFFLLQGLNGNLVNFPMETAFVTHNVSEWIWGYNDPLLAKDYPTNSPLVQLFTPVTEYGPNEMYTGKGGNKPGMSATDSIYQYTMWNGYRSLPSFWGTPYANMINGTDGTQFKPNLQNSDMLYVFVDSIGRSGMLSYSQDVDLNGVTLKQFVIAQEMLQSQYENPNNAAFFMTTHGFLPTPAPLQLPVTISKARFMDCNKSQVNINVNGFNPPQVDPAVHDILIGIEPMTGAVFSAQKRLQLNVFLQPIVFMNPLNLTQKYNLTGFENLPTTWYPLMYASEYGIATQSVCDDFISAVYTPLRIGKYGGIASFVTCFLLIVATGLFYRRVRKQESEEEDPLINI